MFSINIGISFCKCVCNFPQVTVDVTGYTRIPANEDVPQHYLNGDCFYISLESINIFIAASYSTERLFKEAVLNGDGPRLQWRPRLCGVYSHFRPRLAAFVDSYIHTHT